MELRVLQKKRSVQLKYGRLATAIDMWIDYGLFDTLTHLQINKAQKKIERERLCNMQERMVAVMTRH